MGVGGKFKDSWFSQILQVEGLDEYSGLNIQMVELYAIFLALEQWIAQFENK